jgi:hypothetical protein
LGDAQTYIPILSSQTILAVVRICKEMKRIGGGGGKTVAILATLLNLPRKTRVFKKEGRQDTRGRN